MDPFQALFSWQFLIFGVAIAALIFVLRQIVEYVMANWAPAAKESKLWNNLLLPILPVIVGALGGLIFKNYPYPDGLTTIGDRFIFGLVSGLLSTLFYRVAKSMLIQKITGQSTAAPSDISNPDGALPDPVADGKILINQVRQVINK